jgi:hypothetical protein
VLVRRFVVVVVAAAVAMFVAVLMLVLMGVFDVRGAFVNVEFHAFDVLPLLAVEVHVERAEIDFAQLPFEGAGFDAEIDDGADHHVAADAGCAV